MDTSWLADAIGSSAPAALGGCRNSGTAHECCEYDVTVFDGLCGEESLCVDGSAVHVIHDDLARPAWGTFAHMADMSIVRDESWDVGPVIRSLRDRRKSVFRDAARSCLVDAHMILSRAARLFAEGDAAAPLWTKHGAYKIADAISYHNCLVPSPAHALRSFRALGGSPVNEKLAVVSECLGLERASASLLRRMTDAAAGLAARLDAAPGSVEAMRAKSALLESESQLAGCYYYVGYVSCRAIASAYPLGGAIPEDIAYMLKIALDPENNAQQASAQVAGLRAAADEILELTAQPSGMR